MNPSRLSLVILVATAALSIVVHLRSVSAARHFPDFEERRHVMHEKLVLVLALLAVVAVQVAGR